MKNFLVGIVVLAALIAVFSAFYKKNDVNQLKIVKFGDIYLKVDVAETAAERQQGLSGKKSLAADEGLLFVFEEEGYYGFWMKDMNFPIDIAWADGDKRIVHIERGVSPETYPKVFNSSLPAVFVLETNKDFFSSNGIEVGDTFETNGL